MYQEIKQMIQKMLSNGMNVSQVAKRVSKSEYEIMNLILWPPLWWHFMLQFLGKVGVLYGYTT